MREPFLVKWPGKAAAGATSDEMVIGMDFYPTLLEMAGLPPRPDQHQDGVSLVPLLTGQRETLERDRIFWHYPHYHRTQPYGAIRHDNMKLIEFFENGKLELYDLTADPKEQQNLAVAHPEKAQQLLKKLKEWRQSVDAQMMTANPEYNPKRAHFKLQKK